MDDIVYITSDFYTEIINLAEEIKEKKKDEE